MIFAKLKQLVMGSLGLTTSSPLDMDRFSMTDWQDIHDEDISVVSIDEKNGFRSLASIQPE